MDRQEIEQEAPRFCGASCVLFWDWRLGAPPCGGLSPAGADRMRFCAPASLRRGAQCAPARVGRPACIRFENRHDVEAKSALSRNTLGGIPRPLPCFSSPNGTRCAGLPFGGRLRRLQIYGAKSAAPLCGAPGRQTKMLCLLFVQLENCHKCFGGQLHRTQGPHFLFACPNGPGPVWVPGNGFNARAK